MPKIKNSNATFWVDKSSLQSLASFWKPKACGQTVLPDRTILIGQKMVENAKNKKFKCDILGDFQTLCIHSVLKV